MPELEMIILVGVTFLLAGTVKGIIGLGLPVISLAILAPTIGLKQAMAVMIIPCFITNIWQAFTGGNLTRIVKRIWPLLLTSIATIWLGVTLLAGLDTRLLTAFFGLLLSLYSGFSLARPQIPPPGEWEPYASPLVGAISGFTFGLTGSYMIPGVLYIQALGMQRDMLVQTLGIIFLVITGTLGISMNRHDLLPADLGLLSATALLPTAAGIAIGLKIRHRISEEQFRRVFFSALLLIGVYMILRSVI